MCKLFFKKGKLIKQQEKKLNMILWPLIRSLKALEKAYLSKNTIMESTNAYHLLKTLVVT